MPTKEEVVDALRQVEDPELGMDIVELGLLYDVEVEGPKVKVSYSLTSMGCPAGPMIEEDIQNVASGVEGVQEVETDLVWDPPWTPERMSDDAKFILGFGLQRKQPVLRGGRQRRRTRQTGIRGTLDAFNATNTRHVSGFKNGTTARRGRVSRVKNGGSTASSGWSRGSVFHERLRLETER